MYSQLATSHHRCQRWVSYLVRTFKLIHRFFTSVIAPGGVTYLMLGHSTSLDDNQERRVILEYWNMSPDHSAAQDYTQSRGFFNSLINFPSSVSSSDPISVIYSHLAVSGKLIRMLSILAPGVNNPNFVPRSYTRLNST